MVTTMGIDPNQLKDYIIKPTLKELDLYSESAVNLLLGTCAQESHMGYYIHQIKGIALGIYQMEPNTYDDIYINYLDYRKELKDLTDAYASKKHDSNELIWNLRYATAMCRIYYLRVSEPLPDAQDVLALATYYKKFYNTPSGKGTITSFVRNYNKFNIAKL